MGQKNIRLHVSEFRQLMGELRLLGRGKLPWRFEFLQGDLCFKCARIGFGGPAFRNGSFSLIGANALV